MIADWVKETTTDTGTGTITLAGAVSGYCSFSDVFPDGAVVRYQIIDANGTSRECGYGTFTASGTTLSRDTILETLVGGTYDASAPSALTLTSGTHTVSVAASAQTSYPAPMGYQDSTRIASAHINHVNGFTAQGTTADQQYAMPFLLTQTVNATALGIGVVTGSDTASAEIGLTQMVDGIPGTTYLGGTASIAVATAQNNTITTGNITDTILQPGWYFIHVVCDEAISFGGNNTAFNTQWTPMDTYNTTQRVLPANYYYKASVSVDGTLDASPETVVTTSFSTARFFYTFIVA